MPEKSDLLDDSFISALFEYSENNGENGIRIINKDLSGGVVAAGSNFFSEILQLCVEYEKNGKLENGNFIIKLFSSELTFETGKKVGIYDKEMEMYANVLPEMIKLLRKEGHDVIIPIKYPSVYSDVLVLEDLRKCGYKTVDRTKPLDYDHCVVAMKALAKFHGLSVKIHQSNPLIIKKVSDDSFVNVIEKEGIFDVSYDVFLSVLADNDDLKHHVDNVKALRATLLEDCRQLLKGKENAFNVLNHGDYWLSNLMFKYDENGKVEKLKMMDFQLSRWSSPAIDIWYFVLTSMSLDVFKNHSDDIFSIYLKSLNEAIGVEKYTFNELKKDFNKCGFYVLVVMSTILPVFLSTKKPPLPPSTGEKRPPPTFDMLKRMMSQGERYMQSVHHWIPYLIQNNSFSK